MIKKNIGICCNDAGASELISSYVSHHLTKNKFIFALNGPAVEIFKKKIGQVKNYSINYIVEQSDIIFCGTGWSSEFEINGLKIARKMGKYSIVFLDHWVNYIERFKSKEGFIYPNEIWVSDIHAKKKASKLFKKINIKLIKNYFLNDIKINFKNNYLPYRKKSKGTTILFLSDNNNSVTKSGIINKNSLICKDEDLAEYFLKNLFLFTQNVEKIIIRPHPSEKNILRKYKPIFEMYKIPFIIGGELDLLDEILQSDVVVGGDSMALVIAMICGKQTYSCCPPNAEYTLPFDEIKQIRQFKKVN